MNKNFPYKRFLITGGAGFIGSKLALQLAKDLDTQIWIIDNLNSQVHGKNAQHPLFPTNINFVCGDILHRETVETIISEAQPDVIVHMAAETGTGQSMYEITRYCEANVLGTSILLESIKQKANNLARLILPSSRAIYGEGPYRDFQSGIVLVPSARNVNAMQAGQFIPTSPLGNKLEALPASEETPAAPASIYASTKLMQEYLVTQSGADASWQATILRFQNVYGPGQSLTNPYTGVLSIFSTQILANQTLNIYEDGNIVRDFVFIDDVVRAIELSCQIPLSHGTKINIGSGKPTTILEAAKLLLNIYGKPENAYTITGDFRVGDIRHAVADISQAKKLLDWEPRVSLRQGLEELSRWCIQFR
ncbi:NAD(P)-dependent oxidoreductase [Calothrix sp. PCC 7507]|uniref:NAD-dependent epimerase/dehydratase family protein n=1 Tax=Calothrix sp. PCC 7507 TaxID=99598 RepID=UPI00029EC6E0|nr:NAD-dependent epimerase/dehydratase family protein [Calothrix sp. PCC 7507]AFY35624.1 dTDP-glucose 4,6-dehydratase [Calothrix sp. PCC 7507]